MLVVQVNVFTFMLSALYDDLCGCPATFETVGEYLWTFCLLDSINNGRNSGMFASALPVKTHLQGVTFLSFPYMYGVITCKY